MTTPRKLLSVAWRLAVCALLLAWIFQTIFWNEGQLAWQKSAQQPAWSQLTRAQRLEVSWTHGPRELWRNVSSVRPGPLALSLVFMGATLFLGVVRWRLVLRVHGLELSFWRATEISLVAHFFNSFLLGSSGGDLMKAWYAARETHHKKTEAVVTVFVDRLIGLFSMLLFASVMMLPNLEFVSTHGTLSAVAGLVALMLVACGSVVVLAFWGGLSRGVPRARVWLRKLPKGEWLESCLDACRAFGRQPGFLAKSLALSLALNTLCVLQLLSLAEGLNLGVPPLALFVIVPIIICIAALPVTPSGLGLRENLYVLMLAAPGLAVPHTAALSLSLLAFGGSLAWSVVGGIVYVGFKQKHHLTEQELERAEPDSTP
jgi:uncharacterized protein (TIRG00374 family)